MNRKHLLATEMLFGYMSRSTIIKSFVQLQMVAEWLRSANLSRGLAPTRVDIMLQYAVVKNLDLTDAAILNTSGRGDMKPENNLSFFKRFVRKWQLNRAGIRARLTLTQDEIRAAALPPVTDTRRNQSCGSSPIYCLGLGLHFPPFLPIALVGAPRVYLDSVP